MTYPPHEPDDPQEPPALDSDPAVDRYVEERQDEKHIATTETYDATEWYGSPDPKPLKRHKASNEEWTALRYAKIGKCRGCGRWTAGSAELHHLCPRSLGGSDTADNLVPLCHECHMRYEDRAPGWRTVAAKIRASLSDEELAYMLATKGLDWTLRYYPAEDE